jgi:hypothetical protein
MVAYALRRDGLGAASIGGGVGYNTTMRGFLSSAASSIIAVSEFALEVGSNLAISQRCGHLDLKRQAKPSPSRQNANSLKGASLTGGTANRTALGATTEFGVVWLRLKTTISIRVVTSVPVRPKSSRLRFWLLSSQPPNSKHTAGLSRHIARAVSQLCCIECAADAAAFIIFLPVRMIC